MQVAQLPLGHLDDEIINCPSDDESTTIVALVYPHGHNVDLWMATTGCASVSNGYIRTAGSVAF